MVPYMPLCYLSRQPDDSPSGGADELQDVRTLLLSIERFLDCKDLSFYPTYPGQQFSF